MLAYLKTGSRQIGPLANLPANWGPALFGAQFAVFWQIGPRKIEPRQIGPLENVGAANWVPANRAPARKDCGQLPETKQKKDDDEEKKKEMAHQSHTKYCWLKRVRFGQKKESTRPPGWQ